MVQVIQLFFSLTALIAVHQQVSAFSRALSTPTLIAQPQATYHVAPRTKVSLQHSNENVTDDVTCYIVNDEEIVNEGEKPHVVCTSEPDDVSTAYANQYCSCSQSSDCYVLFYKDQFKGINLTLTYMRVEKICYNLVCMVQWYRSKEYERD